MSYVPPTQNRWANLKEPVVNTQGPLANLKEPLANLKEPVANLKEPVVNTSLPARMAPKLAPKTLAQATTYNNPYTSHKKVQAAPTLDDFPSLTISKPTASMKLTAFNYASLSRDWAKKQKEDEIAQKEKAAADAITQRFLQEAREKEHAEKQMIRRIRVGMTHIPSQRKPDSDEEKYEEEEEVEEDDSFSDTPDDEYEEEKDEDEDDGWNGRKHRDELY